MKINYTYENNQKDILTISVDEDEWRKVHRAILGSKPSLPKECTTLSEFEDLFYKLEYNGARRYALMRLGLKSQSSHELRRQMQLKLVSDTIIEKVIKECVQFGYLNDEDWLESFIRFQTARHAGPQSIKTKLRLKGISPEIIEEAFEKAGLRDLQGEQIKKLLDSRYRSRNLKDRKERDKVISALVRKGFDLSSIFAVLKD